MPEICTPVALPAVKADFCAPNLNFGEIDRVYLGNPGNPFTDWSLLAEWDARLDNADIADATKIRMLHVIGDKPAGEKTKIDFSQGRSVYTEGKHSINIKVDETGDENYELIIWLEENAGQTVSLWYQAGKYIYGGNDGISASLTLDDIIPESDEELNTFNGAATWEGNHPERIPNPMA